MMQVVTVVIFTGEYLPPQLIYKGKTPRCHPQVSFPEKWDIWHSENHWSNETTTKRYIENILLPFVSKKREELKLSKSHPALVIFDCFRGQTTDGIKKLLAKNNILTVPIPPNCTHKLQPMDVSINKPMKEELRKRFQAWYASEVEKQLKEVSIENVKVDVGPSNVKGHSANWIISAWQSIEARPEIAVNGFRKAGIMDAIAAIKN